MLKGTANDLSFSATNDDGALVASDAFHIIPDQIDRNVIRGKETDYLVGQQIRREYELRDRINSAFVSAYVQAIPLDRQVKDWERAKFPMSKATLCNWILEVDKYYSR